MTSVSPPHCPASPPWTYLRRASWHTGAQPPAPLSTRPLCHPRSERIKINPDPWKEAPDHREEAPGVAARGEHTHWPLPSPWVTRRPPSGNKCGLQESLRHCCSSGLCLVAAEGTPSLSPLLAYFYRDRGVKDFIHTHTLRIWGIWSRAAEKYHVQYQSHKIKNQIK